VSTVIRAFQAEYICSERRPFSSQLQVKNILETDGSSLISCPIPFSLGVVASYRGETTGNSKGMEIDG
jgi:hypothetical protein